MPMGREPDRAVRSRILWEGCKPDGAGWMTTPIAVAPLPQVNTASMRDVVGLPDEASDIVVQLFQ